MKSEFKENLWIWYKTFFTLTLACFIMLGSFILTYTFSSENKISRDVSSVDSKPTLSELYLDNFRY